MRRPVYVAGVLNRLSEAKHVERQVRGRRLSSAGPVRYQSTGSANRPVRPVASWQIPGACELLREYNVQQLEVGAMAHFSLSSVSECISSLSCR